MTDIGTEFKGVTATFLKEHNVRHMVPQRGATHTHTAIVERFNKTITGPLFKQQHTRERENMSDKQADEYEFNTEWVEKLQQFITAYNNREHHAFYYKMTPTQAFDNPEEVVYARQFVPDEPPSLEIGTIVKRPQPSQAIRQRYMRETFSNVLYVIADILPGNPFTPTRYIIVQQDTGVAEPIPYYRQQLLVASTEKVDMDEVLRIREPPIAQPVRPKAPQPRSRQVPQTPVEPPPKPQATRTGRAIHAPKNRWLDQPSVGGSIA